MRRALEGRDARSLYLIGSRTSIEGVFTVIGAGGRTDGATAVVYLESWAARGRGQQEVPRPVGLVAGWLPNCKCSGDGTCRLRPWPFPRDDDAGVRCSCGTDPGNERPGSDVRFVTCM